MAPSQPPPPPSQHQQALRVRTGRIAKKPPTAAEKKSRKQHHDAAASSSSSSSSSSAHNDDRATARNNSNNDDDNACTTSSLQGMHEAKAVIACHLLHALDGLSPHKYDLAYLSAMYEAAFHAPLACEDVALRKRRLKKLVMYCELRSLHEDLAGPRGTDALLAAFAQRFAGHESDTPRRERAVVLIRMALRMMMTRVAGELKALASD